MVCKEEICAWFRDLRGSKRIDVMCSLLQLCHPLELRFIGSCVEDLARRDFHYLREMEIKANDAAELGSLTNLFERDTRTKLPKLTVYMTLLYTSNAVCSNIIFNILTAHTLQALPTLTLTTDFAEELVVLLTVASNHPAFTFHQRGVLFDLLLRVEKFCGCVLGKEESEKICLHNHPAGDGLMNIPNIVPVTPVDHPAPRLNCDHPASCVPLPINGGGQPTAAPHHTKCSNVHTNKKLAYVKNLEIKGSPRRVADKWSEFLIQITWSDGDVSEICKTYQELNGFHMELIKQVQRDSTHRPDKIWNAWFQEKSISNNHKDIEDQVHKYLVHLTKLPESILQCDQITNFFRPQSAAPSPAGRQCNLSAISTGIHKVSLDDDQSSSPVHVKSLTVYNSQHRDSNARPAKGPHGPGLIQQGVPANSHRHPIQYTGSPQSSPRPSPLSSPHLSPAASTYSSRSTSPRQQQPFDVNKWLKKLRLHKYREQLGRHTIQELLNLTEKDLESYGLTFGARNKFMQALRDLKGHNGIALDALGDPSCPSSPPNAWVKNQQLVPPTPNIDGGGNKPYSASLDSSGETSYSETNSRPPSPSVASPTTRQDEVPAEDLVDKGDFDHVDADLKEEVPYPHGEPVKIGMHMPENMPVPFPAAMMNFGDKRAMDLPLQHPLVSMVHSMPRGIGQMVPNCMSESYLHPQFAPRQVIRSPRPQAKPVVHGSANLMSGPKITNNGGAPYMFEAPYFPRISTVAAVHDVQANNTMTPAGRMPLTPCSIITNTPPVPTSMISRPTTLGIPATFCNTSGTYSMASTPAPAMMPGPPPSLNQVVPPEGMKVAYTSHNSIGNTPTSSTISYASSSSSGYPSPVPAAPGHQHPSVPTPGHSPCLTPTPGSHGSPQVGTPNPVPPHTSAPLSSSGCSACGCCGNCGVPSNIGGMHYNIPVSVWSHHPHPMFPPGYHPQHTLQFPPVTSNGVIPPNMFYSPHPVPGPLPNGMPPEAMMMPPNFPIPHPNPGAFMANHAQAMGNPHLPVGLGPKGKTECYNCGSSTHAGIDCKESTMSLITSLGNYHLDYKPVAKSDSE